MNEYFVSKKLDSERSKDKGKIIPVRFNEDELEYLKKACKLLSQPKESTTIKQMVEIGYKAIQSDLVSSAIKTVFKNKQRKKI